MQIFYSCNSQKETEDNALQNGKYYYKLDKSEVLEYLELTINDKKVEGKIFTNEEVAGEVFYSFKGELMQDSLLNVKVHYSTDDIAENWIAHFNKDKLLLKNSIGRQAVYTYTIVPSDQMPDESKYESVEEIRKDEEAEGTENNIK